MKTVKQTIIIQQLENERLADLQRIKAAGEHTHVWYSKTAEDYAVQGLRAPGYIAHDIRCRVCGVRRSVVEG